MALPLAHELVMGKTAIFWTGLLAFLFFASAGLAMGLNRYAKTRFTLDTHRMLAAAGLILALAHMALALG